LSYSVQLNETDKDSYQHWYQVLKRFNDELVLTFDRKKLIPDTKKSLFTQILKFMCFFLTTRSPSWFYLDNHLIRNDTMFLSISAMVQSSCPQLGRRTLFLKTKNR